MTAQPKMDGPGQGARLSYSISEAAALLGVSRQTLWRWVRDGRLPVARLGHRTVRITREDIERLLADFTAGGARAWVLRGTVAAGEAEQAPPCAECAGALAAPVWSEGDVAETTAGGCAESGVAYALTGACAEGGAEASAHIVQFYESDSFLLDRVAAFIGAALREGGSGLVVATAPHREGIAARLDGAGLGVAALTTAGRYRALDAAELLERFMRDGEPDADRFMDVVGEAVARIAAGGRGLRVFGEMVALLVAEGNQAAAIRLEQLWNDLQRRQSFSLLCAYPAELLSGAGRSGLLDEVCAEHSAVLPAEKTGGRPRLPERVRATATLRERERWLEGEIQERRLAVEAQARLAAIVDGSDDAIIGKTLEGVITSWNRGAERLYGYTADEAIGRPISLLIPPDRPDELPGIMARLTRGERIEHFETVRRRKDGTLLDVSLTISPIRGLDGEIVGASAIARDITEQRRQAAALRESERRLRAVLDTLPVGVWLTDAEGTIVLDNPAGARIWGERPPPGDHFGRYKGRRPDTGEELRPGDWSLARTLASGEPVLGEVLEIERADGERRTILSSTAPLLDAFGRVQGAVVVNEDISALTAVDRALREAVAARDRALAEAQAALRVREEFIGSVSHDLRTPLSIIKGLTQLLLRQAGRSAALGGDQLVRPLTEVERATAKMNAMIDELLDVSRLETGRPLHLQRQPLDMVALVRQLAADHQRTTGRHRIVVECDAAELTGSWDGGRLERVLSNLLSNAIKYSPGGGEIRVRARQVGGPEGAAGEGWVEVTVQDSGIGIPAEDLPQIFDRFHRGRNVDGIRGAGVGLAGTKQIVEQHGGAISVASVEGAGATVTLRLPCAPEETPPSGQER